VELSELGDDHVVVVVAPRVSRDRTGGLRSTVAQRDDDRAPRAGDGQSCVAPLLGAAGKVGHVARVPARDPLVERRRGLRRAEHRDAGEIEAQAVRLRLDE
jgi:hypothetical protein